MKLYLVQHGEATDKEINPDRPLTKKGRNDSIKTAKFLKAADVNIDIIWHSTKTRSIETARIFSETLLPKEGIEQKEILAPNDSVKEALEHILPTNRNIMLIGHLPFLQKLASFLLLDSESHEVIKFSMGGIVCFEQNKEGKWQLIFEITPNLLP